MARELINTNPFKDIEELRTEVDKLWDAFLFGRPQMNAFQEIAEWLPAVDVAGTKGEIVVTVEIPGTDARDIDISLDEGTLTIKGEKKQEKEEEEQNYHLIERRYGTFVRPIPLPRGVESDKVTASYKQGILKITLPKSEGTQRKEIKIKVE